MLTTFLFAALLQSSDLYRLRAVTSVAMSPDGKRVAYAIERNEKPDGRCSRSTSSI